MTLRLHHASLLAVAACSAAPPTPEAVADDQQAMLHYQGDDRVSYTDPTHNPSGTFPSQTGQFQTQPVTNYFIFYGKWTAAQRQIFLDFSQGLSGSPPASVLGSYYDPDGQISGVIGTHATPVVLSGYPLGHTLGEAVLPQVVELAITQHGLPRDTSGTYWIIPDATIGGSSSSFGDYCSFCGYHPVDTLGGPALSIIFGVHPGYCRAHAPDGGAPRCQWRNDPGTGAAAGSSPNDDPDVDELINVYWHELAESMTDPVGTGFHLADPDRTSGLEEVGDACEGSYGRDVWSYGSTRRFGVGAAQLDLDYVVPGHGNSSANVHLGSRDFLLQPIWQHADFGGCARRLALGRPGAAPGLGAVTGDLDGNGVADLIFRDSATGTITGWLYDGSGNVLSSATIGAPAPDWQVYGVGNFGGGFGDHSASLLLRSMRTNEIVLWYLSGTTRVHTATLTTAPVYQIIKAVGDFDGNGKMDILFQSAVDNTTRVWLDHGAAAFDVASLPLTSSYPATSVDNESLGAGDFDGDGHADVLWHDLTGDTYRLWTFGSLDTTTHRVTITATTVSLPLDHVVGIVDVDRDGIADVVGKSGAGLAVARMSGGHVASTLSLGAFPSSEWRFSGGSAYGPPGSGRKPAAAGLLWRDRRTGDVRRSLVSGTTVTDQTIASAIPTHWELVSY